MMAEFHFIRPWWLLALLPCAALLAWHYLEQGRKGIWTSYVEPQLWPHVLAGLARARGLRALLPLALAAALCVLALAGPTWQRLPQPVFRNESALVIALDLSSSMDCEDIKPSRLQRARHKLLDVLARRAEGQTALVVYAGAAFAVTPLTDDVNTIRAQAANLETRLMPAQGGRADLAADKALELFAQGGVRRGHLLLITDHVEPGIFEPARERLLGAGHGLSILGVGTLDGAPIPVAGGGFLKDGNGAIVIARLNESELKRLAPYRRISIDDRDIDYLLPDSNPQLFADAATATGLATDTWRDEGPWLLLPLLLLSALAFRRGLLLWACLLFMPWPQPAQAFDWRDLWLNDDQRGKRAFDAEQYDNAQQLFDDAEWRAASAYRRGDYEQAVEALKEATSAEAHYNRGNALVRLGRIEEAIASYDRALEQDPRHADASFNRELLLKLPKNPEGQAGQQQDPSQQNPQSRPDQQQQQGQDGSQDSSQDPSQEQEQQPQQSDSGEQQQAQGESPQERQQQQQQAQDQNQDQDSGESEQEQAQPEQSQTQGQDQADDNEPDQERENMEQWLRRVPDDPGGLLRKKFQYQYRKQQQEQQQPPERNPW